MISELGSKSHGDKIKLAYFFFLFISTMSLLVSCNGDNAIQTKGTKGPNVPPPPIAAVGVWSGSTTFNILGEDECSEKDVTDGFTEPIRLTVAQSNGNLEIRIDRLTDHSSITFSGLDSKLHPFTSTAYSRASSCPGKTPHGWVSATFYGNWISGEIISSTGLIGPIVATHESFQAKRQ